MIDRGWHRRWGRGSLAPLVALAVVGTAGISVGLPACNIRSQADSNAQTPAPAQPANLNFTLKDMNGQDVRLADLKGRPLLINFWATWCGPCKLEIPALVELVDEYKAQNFTVVGISVDDSPEELKKFAAEYKINYPILVGLGHDDLLEAFDAEFGVPVSVFVRRDGTISEKHAGTQTKQWFGTQIKALF